MAQYAEIVAVDAPEAAAQGETVDIAIRVKNTYSATISIRVAAGLVCEVEPAPEISFDEYGANIEAGAVYAFNGHFVMPGCDVDIYSWSFWYGADGHWHTDDFVIKTVSNATPSVKFEGFAVTSIVKA